MSREIRKVPSDWVHPVDTDTGSHIPLMPGSGDDELDNWLEERKKWESGTHEEAEEARAKYGCTTYTSWAGGPPNPDDYMDAHINGRPCTHYQMYETCSEGTPCRPYNATIPSDTFCPVCETPEECARWCADNKASAFGSQAGDLDYWMGVASGGLGAVRSGSLVFL